MSRIFKKIWFRAFTVFAAISIQFIGVAVWADQDKNQNQRSFRVVAWNIHAEQSFSKLKKEFERNGFRDAEVIALQEAKDPVLTRLASELGYEMVRDDSDVILSRLPIVEWGAVVVNTDTGRDATWATVDVPHLGPVRIYSPHFSYKVERNPFIPKIRKQEMKNLIAHADLFDGPSVVAGDLNTLGKVFFGQRKEPLVKVARDAGFVDAMKKCNRHTQRAGKFLPIGRIDWILSRDLERRSCMNGKFGPSDHRWLLAEFSY